jgi:hypothetical protein
MKNTLKKQPQPHFQIYPKSNNRREKTSNSSKKNRRGGGDAIIDQINVKINCFLTI